MPDRDFNIKVNTQADTTGARDAARSLRAISKQAGQVADDFASARHWEGFFNCVVSAAIRG